jgi:hypothetical protein
MRAWACHCQHAHRLLLHEGERRGAAWCDGHVHLRDTIAVFTGAPPLERHMRRLEPLYRAKQILAGEVLRAADAGGSEGEAAALHVAHEVHADPSLATLPLTAKMVGVLAAMANRRELGERIHALRERSH